MMSSKGPSSAATGGRNRTGTVNGDRGNKALSQEAVRLFKTQDLGYVRTVRNQVQREVDQLRQGVVGIEAGGKRTVFLESAAELSEMRGEGGGDVEWDEDEDDEDEDMDSFSDDELEEESEVKEAISETTAQRNLRKLQEKERGKLETRLEAAEERLKALAQAEEALDLQRAKMAKTATVGGVNKNGIKFKIRERKR
jgi:U3 small nucleolar RNA-associated protein 11